MSDPYVEYSISTGRITAFDATGTPSFLGIGYAGNGLWINDPNSTSLEGRGPLPAGRYEIVAAEDDPVVGFFALPLTPDPSNAMFGRSGFFVHGDNPQANHTASRGCIVAHRQIRQVMATYSRLLVVP